MFKARKITQVSGHIHFEHILFFRVAPRYLNLKLFQSCCQSRFRTLAYAESEVY